MSEKHIPIPKKWNSCNWHFAISEKHGLEIARDQLKRSRKITFPTFHRNMVNTFGACDEACAAYLWNRAHPNPVKHRKFLVEFTEDAPKKFPVGTRVIIVGDAKDDLYADLLSDQMEGDISGKEYGKWIDAITEDKTFIVVGHDEGLAGAHKLTLNGKDFRYEMEYQDLKEVADPKPGKAIWSVSVFVECFATVEVEAENEEGAKAAALKAKASKDDIEEHTMLIKQVETVTKL